MQLAREDIVVYDGRDNASAAKQHVVFRGDSGGGYAVRTSKAR